MLHAPFNRNRALAGTPLAGRPALSSRGLSASPAGERLQPQASRPSTRRSGAAGNSKCIPFPQPTTLIHRGIHKHQDAALGDTPDPFEKPGHFTVRVAASLLLLAASRLS
jgi:hypothetical protein